MRRFLISFTAVPRFPLALLVITCLLGSCSPPADQTDGSAIPVWGRFEAAFVATGTPDPDTDLTVRFTSPGGQVHTVTGFWDGENTWRVRFMPDEAGSWHYQTTAVPAAEGLDAQEGRFAARTGDASTNRFLQHGSIRVSENGRYLVHADGTPFFWLGDTAWNGALRSTDEAWETYLADRSEKHFTGIQFVTTQWRAALANAEGMVAYTGFEDIEINPSFFQRIDERIDAINEAGLLAAPVLLWTLGEPEQNPGKLPEDQAIKLARYLVARYGAHHVLWILAGDENYSGETGARWRRIGRAVFGDTDHAPVTLHPQGMQWHFDDFSDEDWLDVIIYQSGHGDDANTLAWITSGPPSQKWQQEPVRPIINSEPPYEDHVAYQSREPHPAYNVRRAVYWSLLNTPIAGVTYGAHGIWSWETEPAVPLNHPRSGVAKPWHEAMALPGSEDMKHVVDLFTSIDWWTLRPAPDLVLQQPGSDDPARYIGAARSETGDLGVVYLPAGGTINLNTDLLTGDLQAAWYNPRDGSRMPAQENEPGTYSAPDSEDWVLLFSRNP